MNHQRTDRIRRAAILVASLDDAVAEQMLASLSPEEAAKVLEEVERLDELDPQEYADVLEEFRRVTRRGRAEPDAVEFTYSAPARRDVAITSNGAGTGAEAPAAGEGESQLVDADVAAIAELLASEQPQTIAVALSRLSHDQGAAVFAALPGRLQPEVLDRIATLQLADEGAALEVESQLLMRMEHHRQQRRQAAVGADLARRIIAKTSPEEQHALLGRLSRFDAGRRVSDVSQRSETNRSHRGDEPVVAQQAQNLASAVRLARLTAAVSPVEATVDDELDADFARDRLPPSAPAAINDLSGELERLSDEALLMALQQADEQLVHRALAASSETFLDRVIGKLSRRQARSVRKRLRAMGPTRLVDLRQAQFDLLQLADRRAVVAAG